MVRAKDVADFFLNLPDSDISNLKLQKLVYYAQGFHLAFFDKPLFNDTISAWAHGPVCPTLYHEYKKYGDSIIPRPSNPIINETFDVNQTELLNDINKVFGQFSAWRLREMTHEERPWIAHEQDASVIPHEELKEYFKTRINSD